MLLLVTFISQHDSKGITVMASMLARFKQLIAKVKKKFEGRNALVAKALESPTPGTALRALIHEHENDDPKLVKKLLRASKKHDLTGRS
jgi:hypothetical protein